MNYYGSDKPDLRIESRIRDVTSTMTQDKASRIVQKLFGNEQKRKLCVKCVKFEAESLKTRPSSSFLSQDLPDILNK
jgi:aspartyl-tRNA synthetase